MQACQCHSPSVLAQPTVKSLAGMGPSKISVTKAGAPRSNSCATSGWAGRAAAAAVLAAWRTAAGVATRRQARWHAPRWRPAASVGRIPHRGWQRTDGMRSVSQCQGSGGLSKPACPPQVHRAAGGCAGRDHDREAGNSVAGCVACWPCGRRRASISRAVCLVTAECSGRGRP